MRLTSAMRWPNSAASATDRRWWKSIDRPMPGPTALRTSWIQCAARSSDSIGSLVAELSGRNRRPAIDAANVGQDGLDIGLSDGGQAVCDEDDHLVRPALRLQQPE